MGVEVVESKFIKVEADNVSADKGKLNIKFGSQSLDEPSEGEVNKVYEANLPKDAVDEWPAPQQIHSFYIFKYRLCEDPKLKAKLDLAEKELQKKNLARSQITDKLRAKRVDRAQVIAQIRSLSVEKRQFRTILDEKRKKMEPLQQALGKLRGATSGGRERGLGICSSEEELNNLIKSFQYRIEHESIPLSEEKQILREIKQLEGTREKVIANAAERARIQDSLGEKGAIQDQVKLIGINLDGVRKEQEVVKVKLKQLDEEKEAIEKEINALQEELTVVAQKRDKTFENIQEMRKQREHGNSPFYQNRMLLVKAKELAAKKDIEALKELSVTEVEKFMSLWNSNKDFRNDYERRIMQSLDMRQLSRDGCMRNPNEKPLLLVEVPSETEVVLKTSGKQPPKEDLILPAQSDASSTKKVQKEKNAKNEKESNKKTESTLEKMDMEHREDVSRIEKLQTDSLPRRNEVDEAKLKEMKREEEMGKAKLAMERKKKLAEKAAAKAAIKAQKEAEKKLKEITNCEQEKRVKKKFGPSIAVRGSEGPTEADKEVAEPDKIVEAVETPVPSKKKDGKEHSIRHRPRPRGSDSLHKVALKRKKTTDYWVWAAPAALVVLVLLVFGYSYLS
ncbi:Proton pump-interactor 1 [Abeliophyllum distichum]|uniref:Proton pump-interactor 1 n=1 Tax=Abeliophyllum distichum TaxID=126358 RepID=A0ABD1PT67_9LAMI